MSDVTEDFMLAMEMADRADEEEAKGHREAGIRFYRVALDLQRRVCRTHLSIAAGMAMSCGELEEAERLMRMSCYGKPAETLAAELRELKEQGSQCTVGP